MTYNLDMSPRLSRLALIAAFAVSAAPVSAATPDGDQASEWEAYVPPVSDPGSTPDSPVGPTTPEGGFSAPERVIFSEKMREKVLDQLCRHIKLKYDYNLPGDFSGTGGGMKRWLAPMPDGRLTIVDEESLRVGYGHGFTQALGEGTGASLGLWIGGRVEGGSMVIRPLDGKATCKELDTLADLRDIKTVLPFKAERVSAMAVGELWRMPYRLTVGHTESLSSSAVDVVANTAAEDLTLSFTFNGTESGAATLTLYRLSESQLRFRFRIDRVEVRTKGARLVQTIPAVEFASLGTNILAELVDHELAKQMRRYTVASLGMSSSRSAGKRVLLEYIVDPRDPAQAEAVAQALHGDFKSLIKLGFRLGTQQATDGSTEAAYLRLKAEHDAQLGPASYAAISAYTQKAKNTTLNLPFLTEQSWATLRSDDTMTRYTDEGGRYHFERADKTRGQEYFNIPWVGPLVKDNAQRNVQVVTQAKEGEAYGDPIVIYLQQHGFLRASESSVRERAQEISDLMALAGTRGRGPNPRLALPLSAALPEPPPPEREDDFDRRTQNREGANRKGAISFTLVFNQQAVKELVSATAEDVVKAYAAVSDSQPAMRWLLANGKIEDDGAISYSRREARRAFPDDFGHRGARSSSPEIDDMAQISRETAGLVADLLAARNAPDNEARAAALTKAFGGLGQSGLGYDEALRVFVQLVDPMGLTGDFVATVNRPKKEADLNMHLVLKRDRPENELLRDAGAAKARFAEPSILVD